uniref:Uncharacterized protein n=1 Tax=Anguilla anguilla TaxID=7936 RepID=A0A0E9XKJ8_ANGAN
MTNGYACGVIRHKWPVQNWSNEGNCFANFTVSNSSPVLNQRHLFLHRTIQGCAISLRFLNDLCRPFF